MNINNKMKLRPKEKENNKNKNKSKEKYSNYNTNYLNVNKDKNKSFTSITNNKKIKKKDYFENILKDMNNNNINTINNNKQKNRSVEEQFYDYSYLSNHLIDKENDTYEELKQKNKKLREMIIMVSKQLEALSSKYEHIKIVAENEKKFLLEKLEKISTNYKMYAESYKENTKLKKEKDILAENSSQINLIFNTCKNSFINLLKKNMQYYTKLKLFYENKNNQYKCINIDEFIFSLKEEILNNLMQYKNQLDNINYPTFFYEYNTFLFEECNCYGYKKQKTNHVKSKSLIRNNDMQQVKKNNIFDEYKRVKKKEKMEKEKDKSPKYDKNSIKRNFFLREKTPSKSNCNLSCFKNIKNFHKTHFHNCFNEKSSLYKNSNNSKNNFSISNEKDGIFGDVGNIITCQKRYSSKK